MSAHIQELTFSFDPVEFKPNIIVSCPVSLKCQNSEVLKKWIIFLKSVSSQSMFSQFISLF